MEGGVVHPLGVGQTDASENITFARFAKRAVIIRGGSRIFVGGGANLRRGRPYTFFSKNFQKLHEIKKNLDRIPLDPPMIISHGKNILCMFTEAMICFSSKKALDLLST